MGKCQAIFHFSCQKNPRRSKSCSGLSPTAATHCAMSTTVSQTQAKESPKVKSPDSHKARKRKHADEPEEPATEKKKKHKKPRTEENDHSLLDPESSIKKPKEKKKR